MIDEKDSLADFLNTLAVLCAEVAGGQYENINRLFELTGEDQPIVVAELAEAFGMMVVQLEAREFGLDQSVRDLRETKRQLEIAQKRLARENADLKHKVQRMTVEIDEQKKEQQVARITDSDYFRQLQTKAATLRARRNADPD